MNDVTPIDEFDLPKRSREALKEVGIFTIEDAAMQSDDFLLGLVGFGELSLKKLRDWEKTQPVPQGDVAQVGNFNELVAHWEAQQREGEHLELAKHILVGVCTTKGKALPTYADDALITAGRLLELWEDMHSDPS